MNHDYDLDTIQINTLTTGKVNNEITKLSHVFSVLDDVICNIDPNTNIGECNLSDTLNITSTFF